MSREDRRRGYLNDDDLKNETSRDQLLSREEKARARWFSEKARILIQYNKIMESTIAPSEEELSDLLAAIVRLADASDEGLRKEAHTLAKQIAAELAAKKWG